MSAARTRLLQTAGQLFGERGYECVGINEVIAKADIAKATFYQHFPSKEALCAAWLRDQATAAEADQRELLERDAPLDDKVAAWFDRTLDWARTSGFHGCPFCVTASMVPSDSSVAEVIRDYRVASRAFWQSLALESGLKPGPARDLGDAWMLLMTGGVTESRNLRALWPLEQARKAALALCPVPA